MPSICPPRQACILLLVAAALATPAPARAWNGEPPPPLAFAAMAEGRFAAVYSQPGALLIRFARGQFKAEDTAEVDFGHGYPQLTYDPASDTLLLYRGYEGSGYVVAYAPEGRELYRLRTGESGDAGALVPGAGLLAIGDRSELSLVECRTGVALRKVTLTGPRGSISSVTALGGDQLLAHCSDDSGAACVLLDWRAGQVLWRRPAEPYDWGGRGRVASDSTRIFTLSVHQGGGGATIASRSRDDGVPLVSTNLPGDWCWLFAVPGDPRLLFVSAPHGSAARLQLLDPGSLEVVAEAAWPPGLQVQGVHAARDLGGGGILLDGAFVPDSGPLARATRNCRQVLVDLSGTPPRVRPFDDLMAVDPDGRGWRLGTRRWEVVGEVPWLEPVGLDAALADLPFGVRGYRQEIATGSGPGQRVVSVMRQPAPADAAALNKLLDEADLCFIGALTTTTTHCLGRDGRPEDGVIEAGFAVDELLWGPDDADRVFIDGFNLPGCVAFDPPRRLDASRFVPGRRYLVVARWLDGAFVVRGPGLFALDPDAPTFDRQGGLAVPDAAAAARAFAARIDLSSQLQRADAVVRLGAVEERGVSIAGLVTQVYKGDQALCRVEVWAEPDGYAALRQLVSGPSRGTPEYGDPVLFLKRCGAGRYELLESAWSVLWHGRDNSWARPGGLREPRAGAVLGDS